MRYSHSEILILFLCLTIFIDDINGIRLRMPGIRISATFSKPANCAKKKNRIMEEVHDERLAPGEIDSTQKNDEL